MAGTWRVGSDNALRTHRAGYEAVIVRLFATRMAPELALAFIIKPVEGVIPTPLARQEFSGDGRMQAAQAWCDAVLDGLEQGRGIPQKTGQARKNNQPGRPDKPGRPARVPGLSTR